MRTTTWHLGQCYRCSRLYVGILVSIVRGSNVVAMISFGEQRVERSVETGSGGDEVVVVILWAWNGVSIRARGKLASSARKFGADDWEVTRSLS